MVETIIPDIEPRFREPKGWRWHNFTRQGRSIRFGCASPHDSIPDAVVVCLEGLREFSEKYFEIARWCNDQNLAFWIMDWAGQGKSTRYLKNPQKRHSTGFDEDIADLHYFILEYIKHSSVHPDRGRIPLVMLAHSMGANLGLRFLHQYPKVFECAAFTTPLLGLKAAENMPTFLASGLTYGLKTLRGKSYIPEGGDWKNEMPPPHKTLTGDPVRAQIHNQWLETNPDLRCGDATYGWVYEAHKSCLVLQNPKNLKNIKTPCLLGIAGHEHLVDNRMTRKFASVLPHAKILEFPESYHEILMEKDAVRGVFLENFYNLVKETVIDRPETLKPF